MPTRALRPSSLAHLIRVSEYVHARTLSVRTPDEIEPGAILSIDELLLHDECTVWREHFIRVTL